MPGLISDRVRAGRIAADALAKRPPGDDYRSIHTPHTGGQVGRRWAETRFEVLYQEN